MTKTSTKNKTRKNDTKMNVLNTWVKYLWVPLISMFIVTSFAFSSITESIPQQQEIGDYDYAITIKEIRKFSYCKNLTEFLLVVFKDDKISLFENQRIKSELEICRRHKELREKEDFFPKFKKISENNNRILKEK